MAGECSMLEARQLRVRRSPAFCLEVPSLTVQAGSILCIAGPNGGGKTTLLECLTGMLQPQAGSVYIGQQRVSHNLRATKALLGIVPDDEAWLIGELTAQEYFGLLAGIYQQAGVRADVAARTRELAETLQLHNLQTPLEQLSHGNKKKVQLVAALMHQPRVVVVDELRNGLDPVVGAAAEQLLRQVAQQGACVVAATHDLWWAQRVADDILLIVDGEMAAHQPTPKLVAEFGSVEQAFLHFASQDTQDMPDATL
jgi:ABC-2 type transport system ATP-binding protein